MTLVEIIKKIPKRILISFSNKSATADLVSAIKICTASFYYLLLHKVFKTNLPQMSVKVSLFGSSARVYVVDKSDIIIFDQMFVNGEYEIHTDETPKRIIDLGSNNGYTVVFFKLKYPESQIYAFEPVKSTFEKLKKNTRQFGESVCVEQKAVSNEIGEVEMDVNVRTSVSSSLYSRKGDNYVKELVKTTTLDAILEDYEITQADLIKFDIEGAEDLVFSDFTSWKAIKLIVGEVHYDIMDCDREEFLSNFQKCDITTLDRPNKAREILQISCAD